MPKAVLEIPEDMKPVLDQLRSLNGVTHQIHKIFVSLFSDRFLA
jgi:hypothetical protein